MQWLSLILNDIVFDICLGKIDCILWMSWCQKNKDV
jgi:hypothetical protein